MVEKAFPENMTSVDGFFVPGVSGMGKWDIKSDPRCRDAEDETPGSHVGDLEVNVLDGGDGVFKVPGKLRSDTNLNVTIWAIYSSVWRNDPPEAPKAGDTRLSRESLVGPL